MRTATRLLPLLTMVSACALGGDADDPTIESALSGTASVSLASSSTRVSLTSDNQWSLEKTGSLSGTTVTWNIVATKTATQSGQLLIQGQMTVTNTGTGPATIGNIVVNLQKKQGSKWVTRSSDVADATNGDDAITALIHSAASSEGLSSFTENGASGALNFMDATNNTVFSLVPQVLLGAGTTRTLLFSAAFNNNNSALQLTPGTTIRAEVIVSFGNATASGNSTPNVDINGNGVIDTDEARVRSVPSRLTVTVPPVVNGNSTVAIVDTLSDITATTGVTVSNVNFNLGATTGTVTATVDGGSTGGSVTNCAHLVSADQSVPRGGFTFPIVDGVDLLDCSTINVGGSTTCQPGQVGCGWHTGDLVTYSQGQYGGLPSSVAGAALLAAQYGNVYGTIFQVGIPGTAGFSLVFTSPTALLAYLPALGTAAALNADLVNPLSSASGVFGGDVASLKLNVDFSDHDLLGGSADLQIGDLTLCGFATSSLNNISVRTFLGIANTALGGGSTGVAISELDSVASGINSSFLTGAVSTFAVSHLVNGSCP